MYSHKLSQFCLIVYLYSNVVNAIQRRLLKYEFKLLYNRAEIFSALLM